MDGSDTLYEAADREIRTCIAVYLRLIEQSKGLSALEVQHLTDTRARVIVLAGLGASIENPTPEEVRTEWQRRQAIAFDLEAGITANVYANLRAIANDSYEKLSAETDGFRTFDPAYLLANPHQLPLLQHLSGLFSKSKLKAAVGTVTDNAISKPAAERLAKLLSQRVDPQRINKGEILKRLESTFEGIVRDLVGRVLLESIVDSALRQRGIQFLRESEYESLAGAIYDFRADFIVPDAKNPKVFIEVRKSSSRHASLYAKDKMFSAINWKGRTPELLGVLVVDGEWTRETLRVMANVFDYVVPISRVEELAESIEAYLNGDVKKLKWRIDFRIRPA